MPQQELWDLERQFRQLDVDGSGFVEIHEIMVKWNWSQEMATATMVRYDHSSDACLDLAEFLRMMCPNEYRLPEMSGPLREAFGKLFLSELDNEQKEVASFHGGVEQKDEILTSVLPMVPPEELA